MQMCAHEYIIAATCGRYQLRFLLGCHAPCARAIPRVRVNSHHGARVRCAAAKRLKLVLHLRPFLRMCTPLFLPSFLCWPGARDRRRVFRRPAMPIERRARDEIAQVEKSLGKTFYGNCL